MTFPNSLWTFRKSKKNCFSKCFGLIYKVRADSAPHPHSSNIHAIRVNQVIYQGFLIFFIQTNYLYCHVVNQNNYDNDRFIWIKIITLSKSSIKVKCLFKGLANNSNKFKVILKVRQSKGKMIKNYLGICNM